jgi:carbamoyltransferase
MIVLGLNYAHADSSACLIVNGKLISAAEEERFTAIKHDCSFPVNAIKYCLEHSSINITDVDYITTNFNYKYNLKNKIYFVLKNLLNINLINGIKNKKKILFQKIGLKKKIELIFKEKIKAKIIYVPHHLSHAYSTLFFLEENDNSIIISIDGSGDFSTIEIYLIKENKLQLIEKILYPFSLGFFYTAFTQFLGFNKFGDEYKFMALAAYGKPIYYDVVKKLIINQDKLKFDMSYFNLPKVDCSNPTPVIEKIYSKKFYNFFINYYGNNNVEYNSQISKDLACSVQKVFEEIIINILQKIKKKYNSNKLYLTGGCAFNSVMVGKIIRSKMFTKVLVETNPGDAGGAVGSAFYTCIKKNIDLDHQIEKRFFGPQITNNGIKKNIIDKIIKNNNYKISFFDNFEDIYEVAVKLIKSEGIIFWAQDKMEWGPRALGNRSIIADPKKKQIKDFINQKIKKRENFRPFAISVINDQADKYFYTYGNNSPNMNIVFEARENLRLEYPEIVHNDNTCRVQTVSEKENKKFYKLLNKFNNTFGFPMLINTSLNIDAPIANSERQVWNFYDKSNINSLFIGNWLIQKIDKSK